MAHKIVILDRDGVINFDSPDYIKSADEWRPIPGSLEAIAKLHKSGYRVYVATNQAGIARGKLSEVDLAAIHARMLAAVESAGGRIEGIQYCPHHPDERCGCRKPEPGMLHAIAEKAGVSIAGHPFVGDSLKDIRAAESAGCLPVLVRTGNGEETLRLHPDVTAVFDDLLSFVESLIDS